jgi:hypothetical protein
MSEPTPTAVPPNFQEVARLLREAPSLPPDAQRALADLVGELGQALSHPDLTAEERAHLLDNVGQVAKALHQGAPHGRLGAARDRLEAAALRVGASAPVATGAIRRFLDALANLGI